MALPVHSSHFSINELLSEPPPDVELPKMPTIPLSKLSTYAPAKLFQAHTEQFTSLHLSDSGRFAVSTCQDDTIDIYDCVSGESRTIPSKKYGAHLGRFTHNEQIILHTSTIENKETLLHSHRIRQLDISENKYIAYFSGHTSKVTGLEISPIEDFFASTTLDGSISLWTTRSPSPLHTMKLDTGHHAVLNFDPSGKVLAVASNTPISKPEHPLIRLYDVRQLSAGPFAAQPIFDPMSPECAKSPLTGIKFSNDGLFILVTTALDVHYVLDAFHPDVTLARHGHGRSPGSMYECAADFTPDSSYVITADAGVTGTLTVSYTKEWSKSLYLNFIRPGPMDMVLTNHRYEMILSVSKNILCFWIPEDESNKKKR